MKFRRQSYYKRPTADSGSTMLSDEVIVAEMQAVRKEQLSWGYELIFYYLRDQKGLRFCKKRGHRLYKTAQMSLWRRPKKARLYRTFQDLMAPSKPNQGWAMDFVSEMVVGQSGEWYRLLNVMDECSRRCLWISAEKQMPAEKVIEVLDALLEMRGKPSYIRSDNGPEYISEALKVWAEKHQIEQRFIQPGKPTQNGLVERLNGTLRRECLDLHWFESKQELDEQLEKWFLTYNFSRPHSSIEYQSPASFEKNINSTLNLVA